jgi:phenylacetate-CoA ligase
MDLAYQRKRLADVVRGVRWSKELAEQERWPRERLEEHKRRLADDLVRHAVAHSPFYRERLAGLVGEGPVDLSALPTLDKATMMEHFDELVTDRRLRRDRLLAHLEGLDHDALYLGEYRPMTTSGSSGSKGLFVYDRVGWSGIAAQFFRHGAFAGLRPRVPRVRLAMLGGGSPTHMSARGAATLNVGVHRMLALPVTAPLPRIVEALNDFQPQFLTSYPSMAVLLAHEQLRGRLRISPSGMSTSSELRTPEMTDRIEEAFGVRPVNFYATTEGAWGCSCEQDAGIHLFEDMAIVENVDEEGRPVPAGERGARMLVTNLFNRVQPLIRFEVSDVVRIDADPCSCGRTLGRFSCVDGRADDVLRLPGSRGTVAVHPLQFGVVTADQEVREFQVVQRGERLRLRVSLREGAAADEAARRLRERVSEQLARLGVSAPAVDVETCERIERPPWGKVQVVVADRSAASSESASSVRSTSASVV